MIEQMKTLLSGIDQIPLGVIIILCATLGLAPFSPPHVVEKLLMLANGNLVRPVDWFDLLFHGAPWLFLILKIAALSMQQRNKPETKG
jgi:hypothetical protein